MVMGGNDGVWPGTYGRLYELWTNWREVLRDSSNVCPGCGDKKCNLGFVRTQYKHRTPCGEFDNWISEILNTTNIFCAAEIMSHWCCGGALTKRTQMDYLSREGEQTLDVKQISLSFDRNFPLICHHLTLVSCWERELLCLMLRCHWTTQQILPGDWITGYNVGPIKSKKLWVTWG